MIMQWDGMRWYDSGSKGVMAIIDVMRCMRMLWECINC